MLEGAYKDPEVMRVLEECLLFICLPSDVYLGVCSCFVSEFELCV